MKKTGKLSLLKSFVFGLTALILIHASAAFAISANDMVKFDDKRNYTGFSEKAKEIIRDSRGALLKRKEVFSKKFRQFESIYHVAQLMRMIKGNMFFEINSC